jgi:hypothetical protein
MPCRPGCGEVRHCRGHRTVQEDGIVVVQDLSCCVWGGHQEYIGKANAEVEEATVHLGEFRQGTVGELAHVQ